MRIPHALVKPLIGVVGAIAGVSITVVGMATDLIAPWEGLRTVGYYDIVRVPTYCYGGTGPEAVVGRTYTMAQCRTQLAEDVRQHATAVGRCITRANVPPEVFAATISLSFNIGEQGVCRSSVVRYINAGQFRQACDFLPRYNQARNRVTGRMRPIQGLTNRRAAERAFCLRGVR